MSVVVGVILMISIIFLFAGQYQLIQVPQDKLEAEFEHDSEVNQDFISLSNSIDSSSSSSERLSVEFPISPSYDFDVVFSSIFEAVNLEPTGNVRGEEFVKDMKVENATGLDGSENYWTGYSDPCEEDTHCFRTSFIQYEPSYEEYRDSSIKHYENHLAYNKFDDGFGNVSFDNLEESSDIVDGNQINLITLSARFDLTTRGRESLEIVPVSASSNTISVTGDDDKPIVLEIPTRLPEEEWLSILSGNDNIENIEYDGNRQVGASVRVYLNGTKSYDLKLSNIHVEPNSIDSEKPDNEARYIAWSNFNDFDMSEDNNRIVSAEVRDRFNNPVSGVPVIAYAFADNKDQTFLSCRGDFANHIDVNDSECNSNVVDQPGYSISDSGGSVSFEYRSSSLNRDQDVSLEMYLFNDTIFDTVSNNNGFVGNMLLSNSDETARRGSVNNKFTSSPDYAFSILDGEVDTFRILDIRPESYSITDGNPMDVAVIVENVGSKSITRDLELSETLSFENKVGEKSIQLDPYERKTVEFDLELSDLDENSDFALFAGTDQTSVLSQPKPMRFLSDSSVSYDVTVLDEDPKNIINKTPSRYKDDFGTAGDDFYTDNIPPIENTSGNLVNFYDTFEEGGSSLIIKEDDQTDELNIGIEHRNIFDNNVFFLQLEYIYDPPNQESELELSPKRLSGNQIDHRTRYEIPPTEGEKKVINFTFSDRESRYIQNSNHLSYTIKGDVSEFNEGDTLLELNRINLRTDYVLED